MIALSIVHHLDPWAHQAGGIETCVDGILRFAPSDWTIEVIGITKDPDLRPPGRWQTLDRGGRPIRFFPALSPSPSRLPLSLRFVLALRARRIQPSGAIVQLHRFESALGPSLSPDQRRVHFLHDHPADYFSTTSGVRWRHLQPIFWPLLKSCLKRADAAICIDPRTPGWLKAVCPELMIHLLPQWADPDIFTLTAWKDRQEERVRLREKLHLPPRTRILLHVGRWEAQKDLLLLLETFSAVLQTRQDVALVMIGEGLLEGEIRARAAGSGIKDRLRLVAAQPRDALSSMYRGADVIVCTSAYESGPRFVFEALACGTPVVSVDVGQVRDVLSETGMIGARLQGRDPKRLAGAICEVLRKPLSAEVSRRCAGAVSAHRPDISLKPVFECYRRWMQPQA